MLNIKLSGMGFVLLLLISANASPQTTSSPETLKWLISKNSSLSVNGTTNINKFSCDIPSYDRVDTLTLRKSNLKKEVGLTGSINLNVRSFDCHKAMMTKNLRKTLKARKFPCLLIRFLSLDELPILGVNPVSIAGEVEIEIAGTRKTYTVQYHISMDGEKVIHLMGSWLLQKSGEDW
jgi:hypothetical protein